MQYKQVCVLMHSHTRTYKRKHTYILIYIKSHRRMHKQAQNNCFIFVYI